MTAWILYVIENCKNKIAEKEKTKKNNTILGKCAFKAATLSFK